MNQTKITSIFKNLYGETVVKTETTTILRKKTKRNKKIIGKFSSIPLGFSKVTEHIKVKEEISKEESLLPSLRVCSLCSNPLRFTEESACGDCLPALRVDPKPSKHLRSLILSSMGHDDLGNSSDDESLMEFLLK